MLADLTIFAANYLVFIEGLVAAALILVLLYRTPRARIVRWAVAVGVVVIIAYIAAQIGGAIYNDPRPFVVGHFQPLISHAADNGFPSDHSLLAAVLLAAVALAGVRWVLAILPLAVLVEWARVGAGLHHPIDVVGSDLCVAVGALAALLIAPALSRIVLPFVPGRVLDLVAAPEQKIA